MGSLDAFRKWVKYVQFFNATQKRNHMVSELSELVAWKIINNAHSFLLYNSFAKTFSNIMCCVVFEVSLENLKYCILFRVDFETPFLCARRSRHAFLHYHRPPGSPSQPGCSQFPQHTCPWKWVSRASGLGKLTRLGLPPSLGVGSCGRGGCGFTARHNRLYVCCIFAPFVIFFERSLYTCGFVEDRFLPETFAYSIIRRHLQ